MSFNYNQQEGLMKNVSYERYTGKINLDQMVKPWLKVGTNTTFVYQVQDILLQMTILFLWRLGT